MSQVRNINFNGNSVAFSWAIFVRIMEFTEFCFILLRNLQNLGKKKTDIAELIVFWACEVQNLQNFLKFLENREHRFFHFVAAFIAEFVDFPI